MSTTLKELFGEEILQHNKSNDELSEVPTSQLDGKTVALYFSADCCSSCQDFTPKLAKIFDEISDKIKNKLDIIFVSWDNDQEAFNEYFKEMPWKALPFSDQARLDTLTEKFNIDSIPSLIVLSSSLEPITLNGVDEVLRGASEEVLRKWSEGKCLFWTREAQEGEYVWEDVNCTGCFMKPLISSRHGCTYRDCLIDLCETCSSKTTHEHPLVEYFYPKRQYSLKKLLSSVPYLLHPKKEEQIQTETILQNDVKSVGFYFSAHWCSPCLSFTSKLAELYKEAQVNSQPFNIIFVSSDRDEDSFNNYRSEMPWPAVPFNSSELLAAYFQLSGLPSLIIVSSDGKVLSRSGCTDVDHHGLEAIQTWARGEKLARPSEDQYEWTYIACDECCMSPLIGQRYSCPTCGNYDVCSACEKKGHEHPLVNVPQPNEDED